MFFFIKKQRNWTENDKFKTKYILFLSLLLSWWCLPLCPRIKETTQIFILTLVNRVRRYLYIRDEKSNGKRSERSISGVQWSINSIFFGNNTYLSLLDWAILSTKVRSRFPEIVRIIKWFSFHTMFGYWFVGTTTHTFAFGLQINCPLTMSFCLVCSHFSLSNDISKSLKIDFSFLKKLSNRI